MFIDLPVFVTIASCCWRIFRKISLACFCFFHFKKLFLNILIITLKYTAERYLQPKRTSFNISYIFLVESSVVDFLRLIFKNIQEIWDGKSQIFHSFIIFFCYNSLFIKPCDETFLVNVIALSVSSILFRLTFICFYCFTTFAIIWINSV